MWQAYIEKMHVRMLCW